jgi:hypothetical protein
MITEIFYPLPNEVSISGEDIRSFTEGAGEKRRRRIRAPCSNDRGIVRLEELLRQGGNDMQHGSLVQ